MTTAVIAFTRRGAALGRSLADALGGTLHVPARFAPEVGAEAYFSLDGWTAWAWARADALVFVGAAGIACGPLPPMCGTSFPTPPWSVWTRRGGLWFPSSPATWGAPTSWPGGWPPSPADRRRCPPPPTSTACSPWTCGPRSGTWPSQTGPWPRRCPPPCWREGRWALPATSATPARRASPQARRSWGCGSPTGRGRGPSPAPCVWCPGA